FLRIIDRQNAAGLDTFLEKTPRHAFCVSRIRRVFPDARFVCLVREPRNFAASNLEAFGADQSIIRLAALYSKIAGEIAGVRDRNWAHVVRYETLAGAPDECIAEICAFLDVEFRPESLTSFGAAADRVISPGETWKHRVAEAGAVGSDDAERWRSALTPAQGALVSWLTRGAATAFGYQPTIQMGAALTGLAADLPRALHPHQFARLFSRLDG
ncbi:MAG: sulfotransferase, partial [Magnetovibrio sp.]|nr:sulfotransferase [Magnetovibrio sp.]